ncbi:MAG: aminotransferase class V-fold PLP-dependent enzyme [Sphingobacteriales bacterium]|jgi:selenocysteine lyase/cysteine desulfurase|nr:aminotransferase class V-fold PLP-dependent enzyme [Sphingobacteriales bacterium]MBP9142200.1 aminotransferase class V-fold PLP-dependent enzyme [Chitinophagales bacterium]MDA0199047.1 aminotransferase class V-fold PLP-dependent enzyme [Bacteroidota bacterium]MBK6889681.1 aminotransferase class V-fold PLP-dependent enzyme [Sphingobacteriales bacterium]MBK7527806.1 aminotransferase class V-fold PLP-dependent enzyme [Sphingobacteriales bacterium]
MPNTVQQPKIDAESNALEVYFSPFRRNTIGSNATFDSPYGLQRVVYADWIASGRLYAPIEQKLANQFGPWVANTHTETTYTGTTMTHAYHEAQHIIKKHVNASESDVMIATGSGMTGVVNKFQRILGLKLSEKLAPYLQLPHNYEKPIVFVTHMEHHSNHTSWIETIADVECIKPDENGLVDLNHFETLLKTYQNRKTKIAAVTSCSNVTGVFSPYYEIARMVHRAGGYCFVDFACSAPYVNIDMHPANDDEAYLDAIYFSPHKFLGGPGTPGVLIFNSALYNNRVPDQPGGGTVNWTNPWGEHSYISDIEAREDGGTPGFLQTIKAALAIKLKEQMQVDKILQREHELIDKIFSGFAPCKNLHLLAPHIQNRLGAISFYIDNMHYNLGVKLLNDKFGIQVRGGCSCAGTYGHYLLNVDQDTSHNITCKIDAGDLTAKPGWIRLSIHPTMTDADINYIIAAVAELCIEHQNWGKAYNYNVKTNEFYHQNHTIGSLRSQVKSWFEMDAV